MTSADMAIRVGSVARYDVDGTCRTCCRSSITVTVTNAGQPS